MAIPHEELHNFLEMTLQSGTSYVSYTCEAADKSSAETTLRHAQVRRTPRGFVTVTTKVLRNGVLEETPYVCPHADYV